MATGNFQLIISEIKTQLQKIELVQEKVLERRKELAERRAVVYEGTALSLIHI